MTTSTCSPRIGPATYRATTQEDGLRREAYSQVDEHLMASPQVVDLALGTLSRWRHGFEPRWDYHENRRSGSLTHSALSRRVGTRPAFVPRPLRRRRDIRTRSTRSRWLNHLLAKGGSEPTTLHFRIGEGRKSDAGIALRHRHVDPGEQRDEQRKDPGHRDGGSSDRLWALNDPTEFEPDDPRGTRRQPTYSRSACWRCWICRLTRPSQVTCTFTWRGSGMPSMAGVSVDSRPTVLTAFLAATVTAEHAQSEPHQRPENRGSHREEPKRPGEAPDEEVKLYALGVLDHEYEQQP
jgi:hypothetical protein